MNVKCGDEGSTRIVFDGICGRDWTSWNAMISGYFENWECSERLRLFFSMRECCFEQDLMTMTSVISACKVVGNGRLARAVHGYVAKMGYGDDDSVDNSLIQMYTRFGSCGEA
ncbi:unnamed protein product [Fraxinus pennsylvanica]|uniref:Pentatricopeptide repeat-containing protein n=1 Tax=Fraxinus pennsylvanica TaxID=56036 RepID=A0AAD2E7E6_9LAMI|nr:unnamed protein product [Fraxinus pennsylvanica]